jgi:sugar lactone lactonase YvrE
LWRGDADDGGGKEMGSAATDELASVWVKNGERTAMNKAIRNARIGVMPVVSSGLIMAATTGAGFKCRRRPQIFLGLLGVCFLAFPSGLFAESLTITTFAGPTGSQGSTDGAGNDAQFNSPYGVAVDGSGNVYVADRSNNTIRKITSAGAVTTLAGLAGMQGSADGTGSIARFNFPQSVAVDGGGNVYVADTGNQTIRKITPSGVVTTLAGLAGAHGYTDGTGSAARFWKPQGVAVDDSGNVYVADEETIRKITPAGAVTTLAGLAGAFGNADGTGISAQFHSPSGVAVDDGGNVYVADSGNNTIRKITPVGVVTTLAGLAGVVGSADGAGSAARFSYPVGVAVDGSGNVYVADVSDNNTVRKITPAGVVTTLVGSAGVPGSADGTGSAARFNFPYGVAVDVSGNMYVADRNNCTIRKITPAAVVTTFAGSVSVSGSADGTGNAARFNQPCSVTVDGGGNIYVADTFNNTIRKITPARVVTTLAGLAGAVGHADGTGSVAQFFYPVGVAVDVSGNVYVADAFNSTIRKITSAGVVTTFAGLAGSSGGADGTGSVARFHLPYGVAVDGSGNVYVADTYNQTIRKITSAGVVTTLAGSVGAMGSADGTGSAARFNYPCGIAVDSDGNIYVADTNNYTIRKITPAGVVTTFAGLAGTGGSADGTGSAARFGEPYGLATDVSGNIYVADAGANAIRKITPAGAVTTLAGGMLGNVDGTGNAARFNNPWGVAVDGNGKVYVADKVNNSIRVGAPVISDIATIDAGTGSVGVVRQLGTAPQTATSWTWSIVRQPSGSTATLSSLTIRNPTFVPDLADTYVFKLYTGNATGVSISTVTLQTTNAAGMPAITAQPTNVAVFAGQTATFRVTAAGTAPLSYKWRKNGTIIGGATNATYVIASTVTNDNGSWFSVIVSNVAGSVTSSSALLTVHRIPSFQSLAHDAGGGHGMDFMTDAGVFYEVQWRTNLISGSWQVCTNLIGSGTSTHVTFTNALDQCFFQLGVNP